jgi:hypothetical protein
VDRNEETGGTPPLATLDDALPECAEDFVLPELSTDSLPNLESFTTEGEATFALTEDGPPPNTPLTLALGMIIRGVFRRYQTPGRDQNCRTYSLPFPCRTLVRDVFVHQDLFGGNVPEVTQHMPRMMRPETVRHDGVRGKLDTVDMAAPIEHLGLGLGNTELKEIPSHARLLKHAFEKTGWDPHGFRGYRV